MKLGIFTSFFSRTVTTKKCTKKCAARAELFCGEKTYCRGGSRGRVQGVRTPAWDDLRFSNATGILQKKNYVVYWKRRVHPLLKKILDPPLYCLVCRFCCRRCRRILKSLMRTLKSHFLNSLDQNLLALMIWMSKASKIRLDSVFNRQNTKSSDLLKCKLHFKERSYFMWHRRILRL